MMTKIRRNYWKIFAFLLSLIFIGTAQAQQSGAGKNLRFLPGSGSDGSVVAMPDSASLDITNAITLEAWVKRDDATVGSNHIFQKGPLVYLFRVGQCCDQKVQFILDPVSGGFVNTVGEDVGGFSGKWTHLAATWNGNGDKLMRIYINGRESAYDVQGLVNPPLDNSAHQVWLSVWSAAFKGNIDQARLWNVARTPNQIREWMHKTENLNLETGLVSVWNFNEGTGLTTADLLGLNNGTFYSCDRFSNPTCTENSNAPVWQNSTAPFGTGGAFVEATGIPTAAGPTGGTITATITSAANLSNNLGLYQFGSKTGGFVSAGASDTFPYGVTQRSNLVWGAFERGTVTANLTFDYSQVTGIADPSQVRILRRTDANDTSWEIVTPSSRNDAARTITVNGLSDFNEYALGVQLFAPACASVPQNLVSWWQFESDGTDSRGGNDGIPTNIVFSSGAVGQAATLNSAAYYTIADNSSLDFTANQDFTIEAWINTTLAVSSGQRMIVDKRSTSITRGYAFYLQDGRPQLELWDGGIVAYARGGNDLRDGMWHHLVVSIDRDNPAGGIRFYVDGLQLGSPAVATNGDLSNGDPFYIGRSYIYASFLNFVGQLDEVGIYNRALSGAEVAASFNAQQTGKCRPTATDVPANLIGWWSGDGSEKDGSVNENHGTFSGNAKFDIGKSGQAFYFDGTSYVNIPHIPAYDAMTTSFSIEAWIKVNSFTGNDDTIISKGNNSWRIKRRAGTNFLSFGTNTVGAPHDLESNVNVNDGGWHHVVAVFLNGTKTIWIDGALDTGVHIGPAPVMTNTADIRIGDNSGAPGSFFNGLVDEASIYDRALTDEEIRGLFKAGLAGKLKQKDTPLGFGNAGLRISENNGQRTTNNGQNMSPQSSTVTIGDATITFASVTAPGVTQSIPLNPATQPALPTGNAHTGLVYDIATTAVYSGNVDICFNLPAFANLPMMEFNERSILHLENGAWVDRTFSRDFTNKIICARTSSLSPFAIVDSLAPTSASVSIGGRVLSPTGAGLRNAVITLTDSLGNSRSTRTSTFGFYHFEEVAVGEIYILSVASKRFQFTPRVVFVSDEISDLDFLAEP